MGSDLGLGQRASRTVHGSVHGVVLGWMMGGDVVGVGKKRRGRYERPFFILGLMGFHLSHPLSFLVTGSSLSSQWYLPLSPIKCKCMQSDVTRVLFCCSGK